MQTHRNPEQPHAPAPAGSRWWLGTGARELVITALDRAADRTEYELNCTACASGGCTDEDHAYHMTHVRAWRYLATHLRHSQAAPARTSRATIIDTALIGKYTGCDLDPHALAWAAPALAELTGHTCRALADTCFLRVLLAPQLREVLAPHPTSHLDISTTTPTSSAPPDPSPRTTCTWKAGTEPGRDRTGNVRVYRAWPAGSGTRDPVASRPEAGAAAPASRRQHRGRGSVAPWDIDARMEPGVPGVDAVGPNPFGGVGPELPGENTDTEHQLRHAAQQLHNIATKVEANLDAGHGDYCYPLNPRGELDGNLAQRLDSLIAQRDLQIALLRHLIDTITP